MTLSFPSHAGLGHGRPVFRPSLMSRAGRARALARLGAACTDIGAVADRAGLVLLMLATGTLLFRPADVFPSLAGALIYEYFVAACLAVSLPRVVPQLSLRSLKGNAVTAMFLLLTPAVMLSHLSHFNTYDARFGGLEMLKGCTLFLLVVGLVDSPGKVRAMLLAVTAGVLVMTGMAVLQHHGFLDLAALRGVEQQSFDADHPVLKRLCGVGVFNDPNDFSLILVVALIVSVFAVGERRWGRARWTMLGPLALLAYALVLTHSRGGLLSAVAALLVFLPARFGWRNAVPMALLLTPLLLVPFWGRLTSLSLTNPEDTFQSRLELWNNSIDAFRSAPLMGIGEGKLVDEIGQVTHNSFLHAFAEMGIVGGAAFIGGFYLLTRGLRRASPVDHELARLRPYVLAITVGYGAGLLSLSRCYTVPTQLIPALGTAYLVVASRRGRALLPRFDAPTLLRVGTLAGAFLIATLIFVRIMWWEGSV